MLSPKSETKMPISVASVPSVAKTEFEKTKPIRRLLAGNSKHEIRDKFALLSVLREIRG